jgi:mannonate dehydratase
LKLGCGFHRSQISRDNFRFARQAGCTHAVVHLVDRFQGCELRTADKCCFGLTRAQGRVWDEEEIRGVKNLAQEEGLQLEALENIDPSFWCDILLDGPKKQQQLENLKQLLRDMGRVGIPILGYNFSLAGVWGRVLGPYARGQAVAPAFLESYRSQETPVPKGELGNIVYDLDATEGPLDPPDCEQLWSRLEDFLRALVPVAEECGVRLAAHPEDPPVPQLRNTPRLLVQPQAFQRLLNMVPSRSNALEFCVGSVQEMIDADIYDTLETYSRQNAVAYVHLRNVRGKVPHYYEVFIDEGDVDIFRLLRILQRTGFDGVVIPDHTPQMTCAAPWHAGMAHALGYMKAALQVLSTDPHNRNT